MTAIATFATAIDADLTQPDQTGKRSVQVIGVAIADESGDGLRFLIVDHEGRGRLVPSSAIVFTDDAVMPPKYG